MTEITALYEARHLQTYQGLKQVILNVNSCTAADTIDLAAFTGVSSTNKAYKNTKTVVDAATATNYDAELNISDITTANIRMILAQDTSDGTFVPVVASSTATLTIGAGPSSDEVEIMIFYKSY